MEFYFLIISFFLIALVYSSVGFGGGSSYLAVLALPIFMLPQEQIRPTALFCNIVVVTGGTYIFFKENRISWSGLLPYIILSVPMAFIGGKWKLNDHNFFVLLSFTLIVASFFLWVQPGSRKTDQSIVGNMAWKVLVSGAIGFLSGLVSIGGGIFLSPVMYFLRWDEPKRISAIASAFILVNSIGGLAGQFNGGFPDLKPAFIFPMLVAVLFGGQLGSRLGARRFNPVYIKRITAGLIFIAGLLILKDHF